VTRRIVVGLDGSPGSTAAARWAARLRGAEVEALTVFGAFQLGELPDRHRLVTDQQLIDACTQMQHDQLAGIDTAGVSLITRATRGDPGQELIAASADADMVVVGVRGHGGIAGLLLGSVGLRCVQRASCPVTVVPAYSPAAEPDAPVVVGVDGSPVAAAALRVAAGEAAMRGTAALVVHAVHWDALGTDPLRPSTDQLVQWGGHLVESVLAPVRADHPDVKFEPRVVPGHPAHVLDDAAREGSLLVVGSRGHGHLTGLLLGSVSLHLVLHADVPTTVVT
jgi:nucleotide-binding universal stress UspA family protein